MQHIYLHALIQTKFSKCGPATLFWLAPAACRFQQSYANSNPVVISTKTKLHHSFQKNFDSAVFGRDVADFPYIPGWLEIAEEYHHGPITHSQAHQFEQTAQVQNVGDVLITSEA